MSHLINFILMVAVFVMIGTIVMSESKYLLAKPACNDCVGKHISTLEKSTKNVLNMAKNLTKEIKESVQARVSSITHPTPMVPADYVKPVEHTQAYPEVVKGSNELNNQIDETLPFSDFSSVHEIVQKNFDGTIEGVAPPKYADPRVMNPSLSAAPVQFPDPAEFGTFGVTDDVSPIFTQSSKLPKTNAKIASDVYLEGFQMEGGLVMDGKVVKDDCKLPSYQVKGASPVTTLPIRSLSEPPANVSDIIEEGMFDGLQGYPIDEHGAGLTPPGTAKPMDEWAYINYGPVV